MSRGRPKEFDRDEVLARALEVFWAHGFAATGLTELTEAMGIGRQSLYDTFGDKRSLYLEALRSYCERQSATIEAGLLGSEGTPGGRLAAFLDSWEGHLAGEMRRGCMAMNAMTDCGQGPEGTRDRDLIELVEAQESRMRGSLMGVVREAIASGELRCGLTAESITATILAAAHGLTAVAPLHDMSREAAVVSASLRRLLQLEPQDPGSASPSDRAEEPAPAWRGRVDSWKSPANPA